MLVWNRKRRCRIAFGTLLFSIGLTVTTGRLQAENNPRRPINDHDRRFWLQNMVWHHRFTHDEVAAATGLSPGEVNDQLVRFGISAQSRPKRSPDAPILVLPFPGGRHPRIGFLDGAVRPQRETKVSVFTPWVESAYVVVDVPEAIWSNLGLTYLAHTHVPTIWTKQNIELEQLEWDRSQPGVFSLERKLPNGIAFRTMVTPDRSHVHMEMTLFNGTSATLTDLRVQVCAMLKGASGFQRQTNDNKVFEKPYAAVRSDDGRHWIITAWRPCHSSWGQPKCPCVHSDPIFTDCPPGQSRRVVGRLWFYDGDDVRAEFRRLDGTGWSKTTNR